MILTYDFLSVIPLKTGIGSKRGKVFQTLTFSNPCLLCNAQVLVNQWVIETRNTLLKRNIIINHNTLMIMNKISYASLQKTLTKKELQNILGGSGDCDSSCSGPCGSGANYPHNNYCGWILNGPSTGECVCASAGG